MGINLKTPDTPSLVFTAFMGLIACAISAALIIGGLATVNNGVAITSGVIGGLLANAYGASIKESGWRGVTLSSVFSLGLIALVRVLMLLSK